ncbi:MAG: hypothetical protein HOP06_06400 [Methylotenera sp.]|nr:hypothetical protein [Methylotenera sp.]
MRTIIAGFAGGIATLISGTIIAIIMQPFVAPHFEGYIRKEGEDGLFFPALVVGYLVIGFALSYLAPKLGVKNIKHSQILLIGLTLGMAIFLGDHLVTAGWSRLNAGAMAFSGALDSLSVMVGFWVVSMVHCYKSNH